MLRVLVVGGAGLVGSHLVDRLLADGCEVIAIDDLSRGSFANLAHLKREKRFAFLEHDVVAPFKAKVDRVFHLALPSTRAACELDPVQAAMTCVTGTMNVLQVAAANGARLVLGTATERWGAGVRCAESLVVDFARARDADVRVVRLASGYGPRMALDGDHLVTSLVLQALRGEQLAPRIRLDRRVHLAYVDDAVETLVRSMESDVHVPAVVAPSSETSVVELASLVAEAAGLAHAEVSGIAETSPQSASAPWSTRPALADAVPAAIALGAPAPVELADGVARTVRWFEARMGRAVANRTSGVYVCDKSARASAQPTRNKRAG